MTTTDATLLRRLQDSWFSFGWRSLRPEHVVGFMAFPAKFETLHRYFVTEVQDDVRVCVDDINAFNKKEGRPLMDLNEALFLTYQGLSARVMELYEERKQEYGLVREELERQNKE